MGGYVIDALAVDVDLASVAQRLEILLAVLRAVAADRADVLAARGVIPTRHPRCHESLLSLIVLETVVGGGDELLRRPKPARGAVAAIVIGGRLSRLHLA